MLVPCITLNGRHPATSQCAWGGGAEFGNAPIQAIVGAYHPGYHGDTGGTGSHRGGGGRRRGWKNRRRRDRNSRVGEDDGEGMIWSKNQRRFGGGLAGWRYRVARRPPGTVPNAPLSSAPGKELHPLTLSMLEMHGCQVKKDIYICGYCVQV